MTHIVFVFKESVYQLRMRLGINKESDIANHSEAADFKAHRIKQTVGVTVDCKMQRSEQQLQMEEESLQKTNRYNCLKPCLTTRRSHSTVQNDIPFKKPTPAKVLMTEGSLRGNPQMYAIQGRRRSTKREGRDYPPSDPPPQLNVASMDGQTSTTPSMTPLFRLYGQSSLKQASLSLEDITNEETLNGVNNEITVERVEEVCDKANDRKDGVVSGYEDDSSILQSSSIQQNQDSAIIHVERNQLVHHFQNWPLYWDRPIDFQEACEILTQQMSMDVSKICDSVPQNYRGEGTFVIDLRGFANRHDVSLDGLGVWGKPTGRTRYFGLSETGKTFRIDDGRGKIPYGTVYEYKCISKRYEHPRTLNCNSKFVKRIFTAVHHPSRETAVALAIVCYEWIGEPVNFQVSADELNLPSRRILTAPPLDGSRNWETASFNRSNFDPNEACNAFYGLCPLYAVGAIDFGTAACIILGGTRIDISRICCRVPQGYRMSGTFVIDVRNFVTDAELRRDGNGAWGKPAGHSRYYKLDSVTGEAIRVDRGHKLLEGSEYDVQILLKRYEHLAVNGRFVRKIYTGRSKSDGHTVQCSNLAIITYYWKGEPEAFIATPQRKVRIGQQAYSQQRYRYEIPTVCDDNSALVYTSERDESSCEACTDEQRPSTSAAWTAAATNRSLRFVAGPQPARVTRPRCNANNNNIDYSNTISSSNSNQSQASSRNNRPNIHLLNAGGNDSLKTVIHRKEYENQERFSALLDRVESFLDRLERAGDGFIDQIWMANAHINGEQQEVLLTDDALISTNVNSTSYTVNDNYMSTVVSDQSV
ncbi:unnamed protein product [Anisakis simplex]|uniref:SET domain-containing protein n=1 Tax=Anisakis simplex TaxID=6269 RepID=A0A0M3JT09_ANISI|nr:unnamed protein product [Anisakis simplex]